MEKKQTIASMNQIRSESHEIYSIKLNKIGLSPYDDKRYILNDGMNTLAYGHYKITVWEEEKHLNIVILYSYFSYQKMWTIFILNLY